MPRSFRRMAPDDWAAIWGQAPALAAPLGPEVELWILRHALRLFGFRPDEPALAPVRSAIEVRAAALTDALRADPAHAVDDQALARGTSLLALFDGLSLALCEGIDATQASGVLTLTPLGGERVAVAPWPFAGPEVDASVAARVLPRPLDDQAALDAAWATAPVQDVRLRLVRG